MKNILNKMALAVSLGSIMLFASCDDFNYLKYDISHSGIYFTKDTLKYSFSVEMDDVTSHLFKVPIKVLGGLSDKEREVAYRIVKDFVANEDTVNAIEGDHYEIGRAVIMPDSINGYIPVTILRNKLEGNYNDGYTTYRLCIELVENDNFTPTLDSLSQVRVLHFDNSIDIPDWVDYKGEKIWRPGNPHKELGDWHPYTYKKLVEQFKKIKDIKNMKETYDKMVEYYGGENLEKVPFASFYPYLPIIQKYVLYPLYCYFSDEANRDEILELYPDYPFNFPNPYPTEL